MESKTLKNNQCNICSGELNGYLYFAPDYISKEIFGVYKCPKCGIVATDFNTDISLIDKYYPKSYYGKRKSFTDNWINKSRLKKIKYINKFFLKRQDQSVVKFLLDIGCGDGGFASLVANMGWKVSGTEIAAEGSHANSSVLDFICRKEFPNCNFENGSFDIVTMWHSLEHFSKPLIYLTEAKRVLKNDGIFLIEVPNFDSWQAKIFKKNWFHLDAPRHVFHYNKKSLELILKKTGFVILKTSYLSFIYGFFGLLQSLLNIICKRKNLLFDIINKKIDTSGFIKNYMDSIITLFFLIPISLLALPFFLFEIIFKKGSIITVWAKKAQ